MNYMNRNGNVIREGDPFTAKILGFAVQVHSELGSGFVESVYHRAMIIELCDAGVSFKSESALAVSYKGRPVGTFIADIQIGRRPPSGP
jgi:GxxExxY protein